MTYEPIRILKVVAEEVTVPRKDGTPGSALYEVPFALSRTPSSRWEAFFVDAWNNPSRFTTMHQSGIASVRGDRIILDGTTMEDVKKSHKKTLELAVNAANDRERAELAADRREEQQEAERREEHRREVAQAAEEIKFDE